MSRLTPGLLVLDNGLDLQTAKIVAPPGSVMDSLNYEQVDFQGQKRIDGFSRYDGISLAAKDDFLLIGDPPVGPTGPGGLMLNGTVVYGRSLGLYDDMFVVAVTNESAIPDGSVWARDYISNTQEHYEFVLSNNNLLRQQVETLPDPLVGLHWFRDRLYAVAGIDSAHDPHVAVGLPPIAGAVATFWESRNEQQDYSQSSGDGGWYFKHHGWAIPFEDGNSPYGKLTSLNQNRQGVGVQGPTPIGDENGRPLTLTQKVSITNGSAQVYGWKTSTSPTVYNLESDAVKFTGDDYYVYADAFFFWEEESSAITAPGIGGDSLTEYPATNTVPVEES